MIPDDATPSVNVAAAGDVGWQFRVMVTYTDDQGTVETVYSTTTEPVAAGTEPVAPVAPLAAPEEPVAPPEEPVAGP